jgi:hypothetical protein
MTGTTRLARASRVVRTLSTAGLLGVVSCNAAGSIIDDYSPAYALVYGSVTLASGAPLGDAIVRIGDGGGARTDPNGQYRLLATLHGVGAGRYPLDVKLYRTGATGAVVDSLGVGVQILFSPVSPPPDSVRLDLNTPWQQ